jgi:hypothetical protein
MGSRPDISYAVNTVAKFVSYPHKNHYVAVKRIFKYLAGTLDLALCYDRNIDSNLIEAYVDANYASNITDCKSTTGSLLLFNHGPVTWCSKEQTFVAGSTTEAEYVAACTCTKYVIWMRRLLANLNFPQPQATKLYSDNQSSVRLVQNPKFHRRTKHTDVQYHFIREHQHLRNINVLYIPTTNQLVDLLTVFSIYAPSWAWYHSRQRK